MLTAEQLFNSASLSLLVPYSNIQLPPKQEDLSGDEWLESLNNVIERRKTFYDERLEFLLLIRLKDSSHASNQQDNRAVPSRLLLSFLNHLQVSVDVSYVSPVASDSTLHGRPVPIRTTSVISDVHRLHAPTHLLPPQTPRPTPKSDEPDEKYADAEGVLLKSFIWGDDPKSTDDSFRLLYLRREKEWVAIYKVSTIVSFIRTGVNHPRLCLTTSVTLRDIPLNDTPLSRYLAGLASLDKLPTVTAASGVIPESTEEVDVSEVVKEDGFVRLYEANILKGLVLGDSKDFYLPSTRLGSKLRQEAYALPPLSPATPIPNSAASDRSVPILCKSFRKTLQAVSGYHVRMRTVFVPHVQLLGDNMGDDEVSQEPGSEESTVILCLEVTNTGESEAGFAIESIDVNVSGEDAKVQLISWGEGGLTDSSSIFPLHIRLHERYDILYAVAFLRPVEEDLTSRTNANDIQASFQRSVSITISGKPFEAVAHDAETAALSYPTKTFLSRWSCVLDLSPRHDQEYLLSMPEALPSARSALPYPPSPFPPPSPQTKLIESQMTGGSNKLVSSDITTKRHTFAGTTHRPHPELDAAGQRASLGAFLNTQQSRSPLPARRSTSPLPSTALSPPLPALPSGQRSPSRLSTLQPSTNANPLASAHPSGGATTPRQGAFTPPLGYPVGYDPRRSSLRNSTLPHSPDPRIQNLGFEQATHPDAADLIISVSLLTSKGTSNKSTGQVSKRIYPLDEFSLELFAFNKSEEVRTYELTYPERSNVPRKDRRSFPSHSSRTQPGFVPLENQICIGPLAPLTCQTVRMRFLALRPGIHCVDTLVVRDLHSGSSVTLRSAMDFVVLSRETD